MKSNYTSVISALKNVADESRISVYLPSTGKVAAFRPLSVLQQKQLIKTLNNSPLDNILIANTLNSIVEENITDSSQALEINVIDREVILAGIRGTLAPDALERIQINMKALPINMQEEIQVGSITLNVAVPSLIRDQALNDWFVANNASNITASALAANYFIIEIVKYINIVKVGDMVIDFKDISDVSSLIAIVEQFTSSINNNIVQFINERKKWIRSFGVDVQTPLF